VEAIVENVDEKRATYQAGGSRRASRDDHRVEYFIAVHHRAGGRNRSGRIASAAFISSIPCR
jgi:hypothetical protein